MSFQSLRPHSKTVKQFDPDFSPLQLRQIMGQLRTYIAVVPSALDLYPSIGDLLGPDET